MTDCIKHAHVWAEPNITEPLAEALLTAVSDEPSLAYVKAENSTAIILCGDLNHGFRM